MTRDQAETRARELTDSDPAHSFFARERDGGWEVVQVPAPAGGSKPHRTAIKAVPRPEQDDPRPSNERLIPPFGAG
jgi:hypothetical protein